MLHIVYTRHLFSAFAVTVSGDGNVFVATGFTRKGATKRLVKSQDRYYRSIHR